MPDLYLIKQAEQGRETGAGQFGNGRTAIGNQNGSYRDAFAAVDDLLAAEPAGA
jgi:hypothetical protein